MVIKTEELIQQLENEPVFRQRLASLLAASPPVSPKMTYAEFLETVDEDTLAEWINGEVTMSSPASSWHQDIIRFLTSVLGMYVETHHLGVIYPAPFQMKLTDAGREPDMLFVARDHLQRLQKTYLDGPADVVVEIVSPESLIRDRGQKFFEYEANGVPEYWLIDPLRTWAEFYQLGVEGRYKTAFAGQEGIFHSNVINGFWLKVEWFWQQPLPHPMRVLGEIAGLEPETIETFLRALGDDRN